jgi:hypothetical protein
MARSESLLWYNFGTVACGTKIAMAKNASVGWVVSAFVAASYGDRTAVGRIYVITARIIGKVLWYKFGTIHRKRQNRSSGSGS